VKTLEGSLLQIRMPAQKFPIICKLNLWLIYIDWEC